MFPNQVVMHLGNHKKTTVGYANQDYGAQRRVCAQNVTKTRDNVQYKKESSAMRVSKFLILPRPRRECIKEWH
jgi:hypothetical protein